MATEATSKRNAEAIYADEEAIATEAARIAEDPTVAPDVLRSHYRFLAQKYHHAVRQLVKLTHVSDVFQSKLLRVQEELERRNTQLELAQTHLEQANQALHRLSYLDALTGVANRRHFDEYLDQEWRRALRKQAPLSLVILDVDYFKRLNDLAGHQYGDECLRQVGETLLASIRRAGDLAARYGGEEFAIVLPDAQTDWLMMFAEEVRLAIAGLRIPHEASPYGVLTVSVGAATVVVSEQHVVTDLVAAADKALYSAKEAGRNRVSLAPIFSAR
ncbi:MAG: diguanylate cyclase [Chloracidobacterium sp.]|uniref:diguanylate cyclase n=1 Tax=Chloracidobacterium validum TaxID=2821543 RepID=A0ABX8BG00_9BACT|nr:diguanylate cyclase [Chloracidobacterium validum]QUW04543.1 GGDEF domain-containing protein [Chloracidobacterium validum]